MHQSGQIEKLQYESLSAACRMVTAKELQSELGLSLQEKRNENKRVVVIWGKSLFAQDAAWSTFPGAPAATRLQQPKLANKLPIHNKPVGDLLITLCLLLLVPLSSSFLLRLVGCYTGQKTSLWTRSGAKD